MDRLRCPDDGARDELPPLAAVIFNAHEDQRHVGVLLLVEGRHYMLHQANHVRTRFDGWPTDYAPRTAWAEIRLPERLADDFLDTCDIVRKRYAWPLRGCRTAFATRERTSSERRANCVCCLPPGTASHARRSYSRSSKQSTLNSCSSTHGKSVRTTLAGTESSSMRYGSASSDRTAPLKTAPTQGSWQTRRLARVFVPKRSLQESCASNPSLYRSTWRSLSA